MCLLQAEKTKLREAQAEQSVSAAEESAATVLALQTELQHVKDESERLLGDLEAECKVRVEEAQAKLRASLAASEAKNVEAEGRLVQRGRECEQLESRVAKLQEERDQKNEELRVAEKLRLEAEWELANAQHAKDSRYGSERRFSFELYGKLCGEAKGHLVLTTGVLCCVTRLPRPGVSPFL